MHPSAELQLREAAELAPRGSALPSLPARQAAWVGAQTVAAAATGLVGLWAANPELALSIAIGAGAGIVNTRKLWASPLVILAVVAAGAVAGALHLPAVVGAGAAAGALATWLLPQRTDWLDHVNGALATVAGTSFALWAVTAALPAATPTLLAALITACFVGFIGSQGLIPAALRFDQGPDLPTASQIKGQLTLRYRPPVLKALDLFDAAKAHTPDADTRRGLAEVTRWVFQLQLTRQTLDREAEAIDPIAIRERIDRYRNLGADVDAFTRDRRLATVEHLARLLEHHETLRVEQQRTEALVDYTLAFLEEARASLALARELPGETVPERLDEVLTRLRSHASAGDARRQSVHELQRS